MANSTGPDPLSPGERRAVLREHLEREKHLRRQAEAKLAAIRARCQDTADAWTGPKDPDRPLTGAYALAVELLGIAGDEEGAGL